MIDYKQEGELRNMGKYPDEDNGSDNIKVFRIEEVILNHAEALLNGSDSKPDKALEYLNEIPKNRNASLYDDATIDNILKERRKELLFEGFRFHDLSRHGLDVRDMDSSTPNNHGNVSAGSYRYAMPIPEKEINTNSNTEQNQMY